MTWVPRQRSPQNNKYSGMSEDYSSMSVSELKNVLRERKVDFRDCLEKTDLVDRAKSTQHLAVEKKYPHTSNRKISGIDCIVIDTSPQPERAATRMAFSSRPLTQVPLLFFYSPFSLTLATVCLLLSLDLLSSLLPTIILRRDFSFSPLFFSC